MLRNEVPFRAATPSSRWGETTGTTLGLGEGRREGEVDARGPAPPAAMATTLRSVCGPYGRGRRGKVEALGTQAKREEKGLDAPSPFLLSSCRGGLPFRFNPKDNKWAPPPKPPVWCGGGVVEGKGGCEWELETYLATRGSGCGVRAGASSSSSRGGTKPPPRRKRSSSSTSDLRSIRRCPSFQRASPSSCGRTLPRSSRTRASPTMCPTRRYVSLLPPSPPPGEAIITFDARRLLI